MISSKNKTQQSKLKDLTGFMQQFMNWAVSHLARRGCSKELDKREGFHK